MMDRVILYTVDVMVGAVTDKPVSEQTKTRAIELVTCITEETQQNITIDP
jgi:hypothetical protein